MRLTVNKKKLNLHKELRTVPQYHSKRFEYSPTKRNDQENGASSNNDTTRLRRIVSNKESLGTIALVVGTITIFGSTVDERTFAVAVATA